MENYSITEVIEMAVQTERLGHRFYTDMAEKFKDNEELVRLFTLLAAKEAVHEKTFLSLKEITGEEEPADWEEAQHYFRAVVESEFFIGRGKALPSMEGIRTVKDAVNFALGFEKETLLYFVGMRNVVRQKDVVDEIINEEQSHIMWLNKFRANV